MALGALIFVGVAAAALAAGGSKPLRLLNEDCSAVPPPETIEAAMALSERLQLTGAAAADALGGEEALGPIPGDPERVVMFATAWATEMAWRLAPECLQSMGIPRDFGAEQNEFGPDIDDWSTEGLSPDFVEMIEVMLEAALLELQLRGYNTGRAQVASDTPNPIGDALLEFAQRAPATIALVRVAGHRARPAGRWQTM